MQPEWSYIRMRAALVRRLSAWKSTKLVVVSSKLPPVKDKDIDLKTELDQSLKDIVHSTAEAEKEPEEMWRRSLRFCIFRGGITS
jgi:hypothetical protein